MNMIMNMTFMCIALDNCVPCCECRLSFVVNVDYRLGGYVFHVIFSNYTYWSKLHCTHNVIIANVIAANHELREKFFPRYFNQGLHVQLQY